ncbi:MAG: mevalonate kinase [Armatimonadota bacterium]
MIIREKTHARIGLIGNPSDGFHGKTIACLIDNFAAEVTLWETPVLTILPSPIFDPTTFDSLDELHETAGRDGYYGGLRLLFATCKKFAEFCEKAGIRLPRRNFTISYDTDIPRQVGLAGSSAIITSAIHALMRFYGLCDDDIPRPMRANLILSVETEELGISAGLQDRVVQVYGGIVYMDFDAAYMAEHGHGRYEEMQLNWLPPLFIAYDPTPQESGKVHGDVRYRYERGDMQVRTAMRTFADYTDEARAALKNRDFEALGRLMNANFDLRRAIYGDAVIGARNLEMVALARRFGLPAKFTGSGGTIVGICEDESLFARVQREFLDRRFVMMRAFPTLGCRAPFAEEQFVQVTAAPD